MSGKVYFVQSEPIKVGCNLNRMDTHTAPTIKHADSTTMGLIVYFTDGRVALFDPAILYNMIDSHSLSFTDPAGND